MSRFTLILSLAVATIWLGCQKKVESPAAESIDPIYQQLGVQRTVLPNGWALSPIGKSIETGDLPLNMLVFPSQKYMVVTNNGWDKQSIMLVDLAKDSIVAKAPLRRSWVGLALSQDEKTLYASGGNDNRIFSFTVGEGTLTLKDSMVLGKPYGFNRESKKVEGRISIAGIALDENRKQMYAVTKEDSSLYIINLKNKKIAKKVALGTEPYTCLPSKKDKDILYISMWGAKAIGMYDLARNALVGTIDAGSHPNDMTLNGDGSLLYVSNANDNTVSVISTADHKLIETVSAAMYPNSPEGSTPNSVALSADDKTLYIANADNNCLAVFDVSAPGQSKSLGFLPTGWYPTVVRVANNKIYVANGKGLTSKPNPNGPQPTMKRDEDTEYIGGLFHGSLSIMDATAVLAKISDYSKLVYANSPYNAERTLISKGEKGNPIPMKVGDPSPIKYVFYVIKENRTYDQVFGDMPEGQGDSSLCLFPEKVSPNHHALAREFVLLDNFYVDAEVSADGHNWSMAAYANDYVEKTWPTSYSGRGGTYDYEGSRKIAYPDAGFIWDVCKRNNVTYRSYGEFAYDGKATIPALEGHIPPKHPGYDLSIKDTTRFYLWKKDFDSLVAANALPQFNVVRFGNDHTAGVNPKFPTPQAMMADNDLALGLFVEHLSNSPIWKEVAIFVLQDDAQNGADHIDAHRSPAFVISPYTKRKAVVHTAYTTTGMLRTMELILGLPPMSQYDAGALPMYACFTAKADLTPYKSRPNQIDLNQMNPNNDLAKMSAGFDLSREDRVPDIVFNEIIWKSIKGINSKMPAPRRAAFVVNAEVEEEKEENEGE